MRRILIKNNITVDEEGESIDTSVVFSQEFLAEVNLKSSGIKGTSDYINEVFLYYLIPLLEKVTYIKNNLIESIQIESPYAVNSAMWFEAANSCGLKLPFFLRLYLFFISLFRLVGSFVGVVFYSLALPFYTLFKYVDSAVNTGDIKAFSVARSPASLSKMSFLKEQGVTFFCDDITFKSCEGVSIYNAPLSARILGLVFVPAYSIKDFFKLFSDLVQVLGFILACDAVSYYVKRIPHKVNFEYYLNHLFKSIGAKVLYTGNKEDRFALLEKRLCKRYSIETICIPHGLEYSFYMPAGLAGDVFYCTSEVARKSLSNIYKNHDTKFIYDETVAHHMFAKNKICSKEKSVVFFPESREPEKNLVIIKGLCSLNILFYIKLHINDCIENYLPYVSEAMLIDDFDNSITSNICLARKSTVLLEALYNNSVSISALVDPKDRLYVELMFPSLNDVNILKVYSLDGLAELLFRLGVKNV